MHPTVFKMIFLLQSIAMKLHQSLTHALIFFAILLPSFFAQAGIVITGTRVIFQGDESEVTVKLTNAGKGASLIQTWMDNGDARAKPETISVPFTLSPPIFRMEASKGQTVRMIFTGEPLSQNKESVFWFNVLEVPPKPQGQVAEANHLQFAIRTRIKVFYRPKALEEVDINKIPEQLSWKIVSDAGGKGDAVELRNPSPFYVTVSKFTLKAGEASVDGASSGMVEPFGVLTLPLADAKAAPAGAAEVSFYTVNDYGSEVLRTQPIMR